VLRNPGSVIIPGWYKVYSALAFNEEEVHKVISAGYRSWTFPRTPRGLDRGFAYGATLMTYYDCMRELVRTVVEKLEYGDEAVREWGDRISSMLPGFPDGRSLAHDKELLADIVATIGFTMSIHHSADHCSIVHIEQAAMCFRVRVPPPLTKLMAAVPDDRVMSLMDLFRQTIMWDVIGFPGKIPVPDFLKDEFDESIVTTRYDFTDPDLLEAAAKFRGRLVDSAEEIDRNWGTIVPLGQLMRCTEF